jgi:Baseplate J-like protein
MKRAWCCDERRLLAVKEAGVLNGIEYLEVLDTDAPPPPSLRQRTLFVRLLKPAAGLTKSNVDISGGERVPVVEVEWAEPATALPPGEDPALVAGLDDPDTVLVVRTESRGDFSMYTLTLVAAPGGDDPPAGFDPLLAAVEFSFKVECPSDFDCEPPIHCPPPAGVALAIDYLAKDFGSFRALMLDRLSLLAPGWTERSPADAGVALVEALAYVADELSYRQDAVATEAYIATARRRVSLRRHARLVDYVVHDGCNARTWMRVEVNGGAVPLDAHTQLLTRVPGVPPRIVPGGAEHRAALAGRAETFETMEDALLYESHRRFDFWTWGDAGCCLPRGATSATLVGDHPELKAGDVLVLAEVASPTTGLPDDADPTKRAAVRLTNVTSSTDPSGGLFADPPINDPVAVTEITWDEADALDFPLCLSVEEHPDLVVAEAWGNVVLADHGRTVADEPLGEVPAPVLDYAVAGGVPCESSSQMPVSARYRPELAVAPVTNAPPVPAAAAAAGVATPELLADLSAGTFVVLEAWLRARGFDVTAEHATVRGGDGVWSVSDGSVVVRLRERNGTIEVFPRAFSATKTIATDPRAARPSIELVDVTAATGEKWNARADLLASGSDSAEFVVEVEHDGAAHLRFGDGVHGRRVEPGTSFNATYRVGNGTAGNVGAGAIAHVATNQGGVVGVSNPLPAAGGVEPESAEAVRRDAPEAFLVQQRAVTADDYARMTERSALVQRAAATFRWTGSWRTVFVTADRNEGLAVDAPFEGDIRSHLEPFRMAGYDLEVDSPRYVALEIDLFVCVDRGHFRSDVRRAVLDALSSGTRADGTLGFFHPDRYTFGTPVYLSAIVAAAQAVPGVESVRVQLFRRQREPLSSALDTGVLVMGRLEIARLDNDPNFPEHGVLNVTMGGGK